MTPEEREELLAAHVLGTLSAPDAADAERLIRRDPTARTEYRAYREIVDLIALSAPERRADPLLRERVVRAARQRRHPWRARWWQQRYLPIAGLAAALLIVTLWAAQLQASVISLRRETQELAAANGVPIVQRQVSSLGVQLETVKRDQQVLLAVQADPKAFRVELEQTHASHGASGQYAWSDQANAGVVVFRNLPALPLGSEYKVWLEDNVSRLLLDGTFLPDEEGNAQMVLQSDRSIEPARLYLVAGSGAGRDGPVVLHATIRREGAPRP